MHFDKAIMNPPFIKNTHLKILSETMKHCNEIVNLSPVRWIQDPLAEYKKHSDWYRFEDVREKIKELDVIKKEDAYKYFSVPFMMDLGIYHITQKGGYEPPKNTIVEKVLKHNMESLDDVAEEDRIDGWRCRIQKVAPIPSNRMNSESGQARINTLCHHSLDWVYYDGYTETGIRWNKNILPGAGKSFSDTDNIPISISFNNKDEAYHFQEYTKTKCFRYIYQMMKTDQSVPLKYLPYFGNVKWKGKSGEIDGYKYEITDKMLYDYFRLDENEIKEIENI